MWRWLVGLCMGRGTWSWIVPDGLWEIAEPLIPASRVRPQGGGTQDTPDETLFAAIIYVLVSGCAWRALPPCFGISKSTAHGRFVIWSRAGVWHGWNYKPRKLHADKAHDQPDLRRWPRGKRIGVHIARKGIESSERSGRRGWGIERTMPWLTGYRRLNHRYERQPRNYPAFLGLAATLCCYKHRRKLTT